MHNTDTPPSTSLPWWRHGHLWLVISGPCIVVVAGLITAWLAVRSPDPVVDENYYQNGLDINKTLAERQRALVPAMQGRNHAATPSEALPQNKR